MDCQKVNCPIGAREATLGCASLRSTHNDKLGKTLTENWWLLIPTDNQKAIYQTEKEGARHYENKR